MSINYIELKVPELREECQKRDLESTGLKVHLVERLKKYDRDLENSSKDNDKKVLIQKVDSEVVEKANYSKEINTEIKKVYLDNTNVDIDSNFDTVIKELDVDTKKEDIKKADSKLIETNVNKTDIKSSKVSHIENKKASYSEKSIMRVKDSALLEKACTENENWECRIDVHLDYYNSDLNLVINDSGYGAQPLNEHGFEYMYGGVKANYGVNTGKVYYEVKMTGKLSHHLGSEVGESCVIKVGWSADNTSLVLGEEELSFGFDGTGKIICNNVCSDYGISVKEGDVIGCFLEFISETYIISFSVNGENRGDAFTNSIDTLNGHFLLPHIYVRNVIFEVNFGHDQESIFTPKTSIDGMDNVDDFTWELLDTVNHTLRIRGSCPPKSKKECEVLMMCGLPSCGKTAWVENMTKGNRDKSYNVLSTNVILDKMKVSNLRKKCAGRSWDTFIQSATQCLNKLMEIAVNRRRNYILDQTNVYPTAQRRRMKPFEEFIRKAIIIVPTDDEYQRRKNQVITEEGKDVPESAVLQMKENFVIPEAGSDLFNEIVFVELQRNEAEDLVTKYNEEAKLKKKIDQQSCKRPLNEETDSVGLWGSSPKKADNDDDTHSSKKTTRWNEDKSDGKLSKSRDRHDYEKSSRNYRSDEKPYGKDRYEDHKSSKDRYDEDKIMRSKDHKSLSTSVSQSTRKNDYKGGFCFAREADDTDKGRRGVYRDDEKDRSRSRGSHGDQREEPKRLMSIKLGRERTDEIRGTYGQNRGGPNRGGLLDRPERGSYNNRNAKGSPNDRSKFETTTTRSKFSEMEYGGRLSSSNVTSYEPRLPRFQLGQPLERGDVRGRGRGGITTSDRGPHKKYSEFNPYEKEASSLNMDYDDNIQSFNYGGQNSKPVTNYEPRESHDSNSRGRAALLSTSNHPPRWGGAISFDGTPKTDTKFGPSSNNQSKYNNLYQGNTYNASVDPKKNSRTNLDETIKFNNPYNALETTSKTNYESMDSTSGGYFDKMEDLSKTKYNNSKYNNESVDKNYNIQQSRQDNVYQNYHLYERNQNKDYDNFESNEANQDIDSYSNAPVTAFKTFGNTSRTTVGSSHVQSGIYKPSVTGSIKDSPSCKPLMSIPMKAPYESYDSTNSFKTTGTQPNKATYNDYTPGTYKESFKTPLGGAYKTPLNPYSIQNPSYNKCKDTNNSAEFYNSKSIPSTTSKLGYNDAYNKTSSGLYNKSNENQVYNNQGTGSYNDFTNMGFNKSSITYNKVASGQHENEIILSTCNSVSSKVTGPAYSKMFSTYNNSATGSFTNTPTGSYTNSAGNSSKNQSVGLYSNISSSSYTNQLPSSYTGQPPSSYTNQPPSSYTNQPSSSYSNQPPSYFTNQSGSYSNRPMSSYVNQPGSHYANQPTSSYANQPASSYASQPASSYASQPASSYANQPASSYANQPASSYANQPASSYANQPVSSYANQTVSSYANQPASSYANQPASSYANQPASSYANQPASSYSNQPASSNANQSASSYANQSASSYANQSATSYAYQPVSSYANQSATSYTNQFASSYANQPSNYYGNQTATSYSSGYNKVSGNSYNINQKNNLYNGPMANSYVGYSASGESYPNSFSNYYNNPASTDLGYYDQVPKVDSMKHPNASTDKAAVSVATSVNPSVTNTAQPAYGDYSQYYQY